MKRIVFLVVFISVFFISCSSDIDNILFRSYDDPVSDVPTVRCFDKEMTVYVNWSEDECTDEYVLMRKEDSSSSSFNEIYRGKDISYIDTDLTESSRYIYRLDKMRGQKRFYGSKCAYGVASTTRNDLFEYNDDEAHATSLDTDYAEATMPCFKIADENIVVCDVDWYYVSVPPKRQAEVIIQQTSLNDGANTNFYVLTPNNTPTIVKSNSAIEIKNTSLTTQCIAFKVYANETNLFSSSSSGTVFLQYKIFLDKITSLQ